MSAGHRAAGTDLLPEGWAWTDGPDGPEPIYAPGLVAAMRHACPECNGEADHDPF